MAHEEHLYFRAGNRFKEMRKSIGTISDLKSFITKHFNLPHIGVTEGPKGVVIGNLFEGIPDDIETQDHEVFDNLLNLIGWVEGCIELPDCSNPIKMASKVFDGSSSALEETVDQNMMFQCIESMVAKGFSHPVVFNDAPCPQYDLTQVGLKAVETAHQVLDEMTKPQTDLKFVRDGLSFDPGGNPKVLLAGNSNVIDDDVVLTAKKLIIDDDLVNLEEETQLVTIDEPNIEKEIVHSGAHHVFGEMPRRVAIHEITSDVPMLSGAGSFAAMLDQPNLLASKSDHDKVNLKLHKLVLKACVNSVGCLALHYFDPGGELYSSSDVGLSIHESGLQDSFVGMLAFENGKPVEIYLLKAKSWTDASKNGDQNIPALNLNIFVAPPWNSGEKLASGSRTINGEEESSQVAVATQIKMVEMNVSDLLVSKFGQVSLILQNEVLGNTWVVDLYDELLTFDPGGVYLTFVSYAHFSSSQKVALCCCLLGYPYRLQLQVVESPEFNLNFANSRILKLEPIKCTYVDFHKIAFDLKIILWPDDYLPTFIQAVDECVLLVFDPGITLQKEWDIKAEVASISCVGGCHEDGTEFAEVKGDPGGECQLRSLKETHRNLQQSTLIGVELRNKSWFSIELGMRDTSPWLLLWIFMLKLVLRYQLGLKIIELLLAHSQAQKKTTSSGVCYLAESWTEFGASADGYAVATADGPGEYPVITESRAGNDGLSVCVTPGTVAYVDEFDDEAELARVLDDAICGGADIILTFGGVSMGDRDFVKPLIELKGNVYFSKVYMKHGKPLPFADLNPKQTLVWEQIKSWHLVYLEIRAAIVMDDP